MDYEREREDVLKKEAEHYNKVLALEAQLKSSRNDLLIAQTEIRVHSNRNVTLEQQLREITVETRREQEMELLATADLRRR